MTWKDTLQENILDVLKILKDVLIRRRSKLSLNKKFVVVKSCLVLLYTSNIVLKLNENNLWVHFGEVGFDDFVEDLEGMKQSHPEPRTNPSNPEFVVSWE